MSKKDYSKRITSFLHIKKTGLIKTKISLCNQSNCTINRYFLILHHQTINTQKQ